ncbi:MAG TPA: TlpA disulfide reductase family protein [Bryobacteraceae bacterium]|nr:TlpA disulfide reductase family protein [Bryobacteraceae bacterium]
MRKGLAMVPVLICCMAPAQTTVLALQVRNAALAGDFNSARRLLTQVRNATGTTPQYIEALSWLGRGELNAKDFNAAVQNAAEVRKLSLDQLTHRKLDAEPALPAALGASIEIQAQAAAAQGRRDEAVVFLREESKRWHGTSIRPRIQKNLNLLTLEGKPAPPLEVTQSVTSRKPEPLAQHRGHPVLLFFWAHWCSDCKNEIAAVTKLEQTYGKRGLIVIAPTQRYGYIAGGQEAIPAVETNYIKAIFAQYYAGLGNVEVPLSEENFSNYGVSTTPTMVLIDGRGIVRLYNPGNITYEQLAAKLEAVLRAP